jgi:hypothetical protein
MEQEQNQKDNPKDKMDSATNIMNPEIEEPKKT